MTTKVARIQGLPYQLSVIQNNLGNAVDNLNQGARSWFGPAYLNASISANTYTNLAANGAAMTCYYSNPTAAYLVGVTYVAYSAAATGLYTFRVQDLTSGVTLWTSPPIAPGTVQNSGNLTSGTISLLADDHIVMQVSSSTGGTATVMMSLMVQF